MQFYNSQIINYQDILTHSYTVPQQLNNAHPVCNKCLALIRIFRIKIRISMSHNIKFASEEIIATGILGDTTGKIYRIASIKTI